MSCGRLWIPAPESGREVFEQVEAHELRELPRKPFVLATWSTGTVGPDIHVRVGKTLYSVPWRHIGWKVDARATATMVQIFDHGQLIATHPYKAFGKRTDFFHYPPEKIAFRMRTPICCRTRAAEIGESTTAVIGELLAVNALFRLRAAQGVLGLADKHGTGRLERACAKAIAAGDPSYRAIKNILAAKLEADPPPRVTGDAGAAAFLHGPSRLFENVVALPNADPASLSDSATTGDTDRDSEPGAGVTA
jgi:hypothetical protein